MSRKANVMPGSEHAMESMSKLALLLHGTSVSYELREL